MLAETQTLPPIQQTVQQANASTIASMRARQAARITVAATGDLQKDLTLVDTTSGNITVSLRPGAEWPPYLPYSIQKIAAGNTVTVDPSGSETIEGNATATITGNNEILAIYWDPVALLFRRAYQGQAGAVPAGVAAQDASNITGASLTAWLAALASGATGIMQKNAVQNFGVARLDLVAATADEIRWQPGFAGTITRIRGIIWGANVAVGTADVGLTIGGVAVTGGALSWAIAATAGTKQNSACTAANVFAAGDEIRLLVAGGNTAATFGGITVEYTRT